MDLNFLLNEYNDTGRTLVMLVGPPGSGKSSLAAKLVSEIDNYIIVSPDAIREELFGDASIQSNNSEVFAKVYSDIIKYLDYGYNVIYDATNCRTIYRNKIIDGCKDHTCKVICLIASTSLGDCLRQNELRDRVVPEEVIERMYLNLRKHPPTIFEGFDIIARF